MAERLDEQTMALRAAMEFQDGMVVNLGVGTPTLCTNYIQEGREIIFQSENGCLGYGRTAQTEAEQDFNLINAGGQLGAAKLLIVMTHTTKDNQPKILKECTYALTAPRCVTTVVTDIAVIDVTDKGLVLRETAPGWTVDEVQKLTEPKLIIPKDL